MSEKYTIVQHEQRLHWLQDCPVLLQSYALTKNNTNNSIFLQCKFENIADKSIKAMNIAVKCSDVSHQELANVDNFPYLDINVQPYTLFADKTPVALPNNTTRNVCIIPLKVIFSDDTTWENTSERAYELAEYEQQPISSLGELADQYKRDLHKICTDSEKHNYLPANTNGFTICGCGKVVKTGVVSCPACGVTIEKLFELNNADALQKHLEDYQTAQAKSQQQQQTKKRKLVRGITVTGIVAAIVALVIAIPFAHSAIKRNEAKKNFDEAQRYSNRLAIAHNFAACLTTDGEILLTAPYDNVNLVGEEWNDIQSISASEYDSIQYDGEIYTYTFEYITGTHPDGTTVTTELHSMETKEDRTQEDEYVDGHKVIQSLFFPNTTDEITLLDNGFLISENDAIPTQNAILSISKFGDSYNGEGIVALNAEGKVLCWAASPSTKEYFDTSNWEDIIQTAATDDNIIGLKKDGTVVVTGDDNWEQKEAENWTDIIAVKAFDSSVYGIKKDGTIVKAGYCLYDGPCRRFNYDLGDLKLW